MHRIELDFQRKPSYSVVGVVLLLSAVLLGGQLFADYRDLAAKVERSETTLAKMEGLTVHKVASPGKPGGQPYGAEINRANEVIDQLARPWDQLFAAIEEAAGKDIALLAIQPEKTKGIVTISGEARDFMAMLDYIRRLNQVYPLRNVDLLSHQVQQQDPQKPVHFNLSATWVIN